VAALETAVGTGASIPTPGNVEQVNVLAEGMQLTIGGSALPLLLPCAAGEVSVIANGALENGQMPLVIRNNTDEPVVGSVVKVEFRDAAGSLLGVGDTDGGHQMKPYRLEQGEVGLGFVYIEGDIPGDAQVTFEATYENPPGMMDDFSVDLQFPEVTWLGDRIVGTAVNPSDQTVGGTYMNFVCFGNDGTPIAAEPSTIQEDIPARAARTFLLLRQRIP
jgi:hypothetical protein